MRRPFRSLLAALGATLAMAACTTSQTQAVGVADGLQLSGQLAGSRVTVSDGAPETQLADCDPTDGADEDLCVIARTIDGANLGLVIENLAAFSADTDVDIRSDACAGLACDAVTEHGIVEVRLDGRVFRATGGTVRVTQWGPRYAADVTLRFVGGGALSGSFDVALPVATP